MSAAAPGGLTGILPLAILIVAAISVVPVEAARQAAERHAKRDTPSVPVKTYGSKNAPITMEIFTDYQCPSCRELYEATLKQLISDYVASGKVYLVHHDFPLQQHKYSGQAARWANAAATIGDFGVVEAALYDNQSAWDADGNVQKFIAAAISGSDFQRIEAIVNACPGPAPQAQANRGAPLPADAHPCALDQDIVKDIELGYKIPVNYTPTYQIIYKDQRLPPAWGAVSWQILKQFFDSLLGQ
jgi:protein-disulfide isomerase